MAISGVVDTRAVLLHPLLIAQLFGVGCLLRCLRAVLTHQRTTFLALALAQARTREDGLRWP